VIQAAAKLPLILLMISSLGMMGTVAALPGIDAERCAPIVVGQPRLREDLTGSAERASVTRQDNVVIR
jgi:putative ABC transport system permease protein